MLAKRWLLIILLILLLNLFSAYVYANVIVNEIMYNPAVAQGDDSDLEWVELFNNGNSSVNLSGWVLNGNGFEESVIDANGFVVVARNKVEFLNYYGNVGAVADGSFVLSNSGGIVNLSNVSYQDAVNYGNDKANGNGFTWEFSGSYWDESFVYNGTPDAVNSINGLSNDVRAFRINEFLPDSVGSDDAAMTQGEWVELFNTANAAVDARRLVIYDSNNDNELYVSDTTTIGGTVVSAKGYLVVYRNGDSDFAMNNDGYDEVRLFNSSSSGLLIDKVSYSGSSEGMSWSNLSGVWKKTATSEGKANEDKGNCDWKIIVKPTASIYSSGKDVEWNVSVKKKYGTSAMLSVKGNVQDVFGRTVESYSPWTNESVASTRTTSYSPNLKEDISVIKFYIEQISCADDELNDNSDEELVVINPKFKKENAFLEIKDVFDLGNDGVAEWGDVIRVEVAVYKGNESGSLAELFIEDNGKKVGKITKLSNLKDFENVNATLPINIPENCDGKFEDGKDYKIVLEGFGEKDEEELRIEGYDEGVCSNGEVVVGEESGFRFSIEELPKKVGVGQRFNVVVSVNGDKQEHDVSIWSYVYKGSKSYSGERKENMKEFELDGKERKVVVLPVQLDSEMSLGEYKLKVKLNKDDQKTDKEITESIEVVSEQVEVRESGVSPLVAGEEQKLDLRARLLALYNASKRNFVVYRSNTVKASELAPWFFVGALVLLSFILIIRRI